MPKTPKLYSIGLIPGKGQAMFADVDIKAGVRILEDEQLFSIADSVIDEFLWERISRPFERLLPEEQQQFETLHCPDNSDWSPLVSRFLANCFGSPDGGSGIFLKASRINHACCPNAYYSWSEYLERLTVHAIVDILAGEEITISYVFPFHSVGRRQAFFRDHYGFLCICPACNLTTEKGSRGELVRQRMEDLYRAAREYDGRPRNNDDRELNIIVEFIELAKGERMDGEFLSIMYRRAKEIYEARREVGLAVEYAEKENETNTRLLGEDSIVTVDSTESLGELRFLLSTID